MYVFVDAIYSVVPDIMFTVWDLHEHRTAIKDIVTCQSIVLYTNDGYYG